MTITNPFPLVPDSVGKTSVITVAEGLAFAAKQSGRSTFDVQEHTNHPETGAPLIGEVLPFWSEIHE